MKENTMTTANLLNPDKLYPMVLPDGTEIKQTVHLNKFIDHPRINVGEFTYYHNFEILDNYASSLAPYLFPQSPEKLIIGKFCQLAHGVKFITSTANHDMSGFSTYPFNNFMMTPDTTLKDIQDMFEIPGRKGDTTIGNDVWIGMGAVIMPGVTIGDGAIIGAQSIVAKDIPPYTIAAGNPAKLIRQRFEDKIIKRLEKIKWWNWPTTLIEANIAVITSNDIEKLEAIDPN